LSALIVTSAFDFITEARIITAVDEIDLTNRRGVRGYIENQENDTDGKEEEAAKKGKDVFGEEYINVYEVGKEEDQIIVKIEKGVEDGVVKEYGAVLKERRRDEDYGAAKGDTGLKERSDGSSFAVQERRARMWQRGPLDPATNATRQFAHLHHMKTGGTSVNSLLSCSLRRSRALISKGKNTYVLPFVNLQECSGQYKVCINNTNVRGESCRGRINNATAMQFCAPLFQMERFDWLNKPDIVTVIRRPVDRVWSMFRFQTKRCFLCTPLKTIYEQLNNGTAWDIYKHSCLQQLLNHQTRNLLSTDIKPFEVEKKDWSSEKSLKEEVLQNLRSKITLVGVTDELSTFADMLGYVFPWMAGSLNDLEHADFMYSTNTTSKEAHANCTLGHLNASPKNNRCGVNGTHWNLTSAPDEETRSIIVKNNQMDLALYEEAKKLFGFQKLALGW